MKISIFSNHKSVENPQLSTIDEFIENIRNGKWKDQVERVRSQPDKPSRDEIKKSLPGATISGTFNYRAASKLLTHSGFICIDIDTEHDRIALEKDPYTYALFDSVSKRGVAIIVKIKPDQHEHSFEFLQKYYFETYGTTIDGAPKSVASMRCVSYDPNIFVNRNSKVSGTYKRKQPKAPSLPYVVDDSKIGQVVKDIYSRGIDLAPDYESFYQLALSLASGLGESGRDYFHTLCSVNEKYKHSDADKKYDHALKTPNSKITIGTFFHMAKQAGIELPRQDNRIITEVTIAKKSGKTKEQTAELLVRQNGLNHDQATELTNQVFSRSDITLKTMSSEPELLIESLIQYITSAHPLRKNDITQKIEHRRTGKVLQDEDINDIYLQARAAFNNPHINKDLINSIIFSSNTPTYNPLHKFISKHQDTDYGTGHIDKLIGSINTPTPHASTFIRKWLIGMQAAIDYNPVRLLLTFIGPQYNGKTEFFRRLLPQELKFLYAESKLDRGKDDELLMCQKLIVMDDEMGGKSKQDEKRLKELTSKEYFTLRAPYRRDNVDYRRLAILCGTSNQNEVISDPTGNTRILPVYVESINYAELNQIDRTALFMECYHAYKNGETWDMTAEEISNLTTISDDFSSICFERELILQYFEPGKTAKTATEIKVVIESTSKQQIKNMQRFGIELRKLFGEPKSQKRGTGFAVKCYMVNEISSNLPPPLTTGNFNNFSQIPDNEELPF